MRPIRRRQGSRMIGFLIKSVVLLVALGGLGLVAFAYLGEYAPPTQEVLLPIRLDVD